MEAIDSKEVARSLSRWWFDSVRCQLVDILCVIQDMTQKKTNHLLKKVIVFSGLICR